MHSKEALRQSLLAAVQLISPGAPEATTEQGVQVMIDILSAFADMVRGPAPELQGVELVADDTPAQILAQLRANGALLQQIVDHNTRAERQLVASYRSLYTTPGEAVAGGAGVSSPVIPPPPGAKQGYWEAVVGTQLPVWIETLPPAPSQQPATEE